MTYDVAIIGAGVTGSMIARELSMLQVKVCLIEAHADVAAGATKANSGIVHAGYDASPGSMKAKMNVKGAAIMKKTTDELGVPYMNTGSLVVGFSDEDDAQIEALHARGRQNGVETQVISGQQARKMEPMLSKDVTSALYAPTAGIVCPFTLAVAAVENAAANGVQVLRSRRVTAIKKQDGVHRITAGDKTVSATYVVNAAGVYADEVSRMAGGEVFDIRPRKGEYIIFDTDMEARTEAVIFPAPTKMGKGVLFAPTVYGNMLAGPTAEDTDDKTDKATSRRGLNAVIEGTRSYVPNIDRRAAIAVFAGLRAVSPTGDFIIECSQKAKNLVNVAGIESPGLTSAPAIAEHVKELLISLGLPDEQDESATRIRKPIEVFAMASPKRKKELIKKDPQYANIVCRCEQITEAQIVESIRRPCGATTVDGVKLRTGAGTGRCHGGFCLPRVMEILARELGRDYGGITKSGGESAILMGRTKEGVR